MANILHVCGYFDPAGDVTRSVAELNRYSAHKHDVIVKHHHPLGPLFPEPKGQSPSMVNVVDRFEWADAVIYHMVGWNHWAGYKLVSQFTRKRSAFRNVNVMYDNSYGKFYCLQPFQADYGDYKLLGSCHTGARDFMGGSTHFLPALMPIDDPLYLPDWSDKPHRIAFIKHHEEVTTQFCFKPEELQPLKGHTHQNVMRLRRTKATIAIDNLCDGHYGLAGTEAMSQGLPAITWNTSRHKEQLDDIAPDAGNPFIEAENIRMAVEMARHWYYRINARELGMECRAWIVKYYNSRYLIERYWEPFCEKLLAL